MACVEHGKEGFFPRVGHAQLDTKDKVGYRPRQNYLVIQSRGGM